MARILGLVLLALLTPGLSAQEIDPGLLGALQPRSIGPAGMSGRIAAIDGLASDPNVLWVGAATGGVWKSTNAGVSWSPVFDDQPVSGIGAIAIDQNAPDVVWVGTGEGNPRNSAGVGAGLYRTMDGGDTWTLLGFESSERIHRILLHPTDSNVAWIGVMGPAWSDGEERGVYKTTDGGRSFRRVLGSNARTGVSDLVLDPSNPMKLFAGMWEFRREPWFFTSGGPGSGLYVSYDGGENWSRATEADGMPPGELGRIGLSIAPSNPSIVYALVEAEQSALLRSDDGGRTWATVNDDPGVANRPFYYTDIFVDPENELRVYNLNSRIWISEDGGRSFDQAPVDVHSDFHAAWFDPTDSRHLLLGTDGGVWETFDAARSWRAFDNLPVGQFYHISVDDAVPYNVYGGMQDNGSWRGPSDVWEVGGIRNGYWREIAFGDGFNAVLDPSDPDRGYAMSQGGRLQRFDLRSGERKFVRPWGPDGVDLRFAWNAAMALDPFDTSALYYGSQFVHKTQDGGATWQIISGDLTTNDPDKQRQSESGGLTIDDTGAENHTTLLTIAPSPVQQELIWAGSDDGKVHLTRSGGGTWEDVTDRIGGVPDDTWIPHIEASRHGSGTAYVVFDDHRRGNWDPYLYRTENFGEDWDEIGDNDGVGDGNGIEGFLHTVEEDPLTPNLLFAGGEFGLFVSLDRGEHWFKWTHGFPTVPVRSLVVHPRDHDLVIGTHGRAIWVLDDIRPLRALAQNPLMTQEPVHLFEPPPVWARYTAAVQGYHFSGDAHFQGEMRPEGALVSYWVAQSAPSADLTITSPEGSIVRRATVPAARGLNRVSWDLREDVDGLSAMDGDGGYFGLDHPQALPGDYTVTVSANGVVSERVLVVLPDPRVPVPVEDRRERREGQLTALRLSYRLGAVSTGLDDLRESVERVEQILEGRSDPQSEEIRTAGQALLEALESDVDLEAAAAHRREMAGVGTSYDRLTEAQRLGLRRVETLTAALESDLNVFLTGPASRFRDQVLAAGLQAFSLPSLVGN